MKVAHARRHSARQAKHSSGDAGQAMALCVGAAALSAPSTGSNRPRSGSSSPPWWLRVLVILCTTMCAGCSERAFTRERIFQSLERASTGDEAFEFAVGSNCYRLELASWRSFPRLWQRNCETNSTRLLLDFALILPGQLTVLHGLRLSPDGTKVAAVGMVSGQRRLFVVDLARSMPDVLPVMWEAPFEFEWLSDSRRLLLVRQSQDVSPLLVEVAVDSATERILPVTARAGSYLHIERGSDGRSLYLAERDRFTDRWNAISTDGSSAALRPITSGESRAFVCDTKLHRVIAEDRGAQEVLVRLQSGSAGSAGPVHTLPDSGTLAGLACFERGAILTLQDGWGQKLYWADSTSNRVQPLAFSALWSSVVSGQPFDTERIAVRLESAVEHPRNGSFSIRTGQIVEHPPREVGRYRIERFEVRSHDGALVPVTSISDAKTSARGPAPILLHAYGAYGEVVAQNFSPRVAEIVSRGIVYVVANIRGGGGRGVQWQRAGTGQNVRERINDLEAVVRQLHQRHPGARVYGYGRSAGAPPLLASATRVPSLYAGLILDAPLMRPVPPIGASPPWELQEWGGYDPALDGLALVEQGKPPASFVSFSPFDTTVSADDIVQWAKAAERRYGQGAAISLYPMSSSGHAGADFREAENRLAAHQIEFILSGSR